MTTEQKAKAYDVALEKFRPIYELAKQQGRNIDVEEFESIFPALKEGEDERIRKKLIHIVSSHNTPKWYGLEVSKVLSWLEKQREHRPVTETEPKFKIGDWVVDQTYADDSFIGEVGQIEDFYYTIKKPGGKYAQDGEPVNEYNINKWTIEDAEDGDVLATANNNIFIFNKIENTVIFDHCGLYWGKFESSPSSPNGKLATSLPGDYHPATQEQCDLLLQKMTEAGYEWDVKKKELIKIEH